MTFDEAKEEVLRLLRERMAAASTSVDPTEVTFTPPLLHIFDHAGHLTLIAIIDNNRRLIPEIARLQVAAHDALYAVLTMDAWAMDLTGAEAAEAVRTVQSNPQLHSRGVFAGKRKTPITSVLAADRTGTESLSVYITHRGLPPAETLTPFGAPPGAPIVMQTTFSPLFLLESARRNRPGVPDLFLRGQLQAAARLRLRELRVEDHDLDEWMQS